jgi:sugar-specific transcriptional regulator TrmB
MPKPKIPTTDRITQAIAQAGLNEKEVTVYVALLELGPSPVRTIAVRTGINRGTTYEVLKSLIDFGLVSYFHKTRHQYFTAEHPRKITALLELRQHELEQTQQLMKDVVPLLEAKITSTSGQPRVRFFEGLQGVRAILEDVLSTMTETPAKEYVVYSSADVREHLYLGFHDFAKKRVKLGIQVRTIAMGPGGKLWGLDERRWLSGSPHSPTYQIIYAGKLALISLDDRGRPVGTIVEDERIAKTQRLIFDQLWDTLAA